jgi:tryptophanyl-tRNA synthetase
VPGLDGRKMSKSYNNHIPLFAEPKTRQKLVMKIVTDSKLPHEPKDPDTNTIYKLFTHFASEAESRDMHKALQEGGMGYGDAKKLLAGAIDKTLEAPAAIYNEYMADLRKLDDILAVGAERARLVARNTVSDVRDAIGLKKLT